jgi:hypothetical protein
MALLGSLLMVPWCAFQLWRALTMRRILFGPFITDVRAASEPISFWLSVALHALVLAGGVAYLGARLLRMMA